MTNYLRPDEMAAQSEMERANKRNVNLKRGLKTAGAIAATAVAPALTSRITPFLSELIPTDLAIKGINKISPKLGQFLDQGMKQGLNVKDGLNFIKDNIMGSQQEEKEPAKEHRNIIEQYSPELFQFIQGEIQNGREPIEAGALAQTLGKFNKEIKKMEKDHKTPFSSILQTVFGGGQMAQARQTPQSQQQPGQQQPQGASQIDDQTLLSELDRILKM